MRQVNIGWDGRNNPIIRNEAPCSCRYYLDGTLDRRCGEHSHQSLNLAAMGLHMLANFAHGLCPGDMYVDKRTGADLVLMYGAQRENYVTVHDALCDIIVTVDMNDLGERF